MFTKILVLIIASFVSSFVYAKKNEVTADMLVGQWECNGMTIHQYFYIDGLLEKEINKPIGLYTVTYKKDNHSMNIQYGDLVPEDFDFERFTENEYLKADEIRESQRSDEYIFISNDEYKKVRKWKVRNRASKKIEEIHQFVHMCIRLSY